jgi:uroporphyrinogen-III decarboxylase
MESVRAHHAEGRARVIVSAGCELPPDTPDANLRALGEAAKSLGDFSRP